jgi:hypothetical protein
MIQNYSGLALSLSRQAQIKAKPSFEGNAGWSRGYSPDGDEIMYFNGRPVDSHTADGDPATYSASGKRLNYPYLNADGDSVGQPVKDSSGKTIINIADNADVKPWM